MTEEDDDLKKKYKILIVVLVIVAALGVFVKADIQYSSNHLVVRSYEYDGAQIEEPVRVVLISDLHDHCFGEDNQPLVDLIGEQKPDLICMAGDFINEYTENTTAVMALTEDLSTMAPVYYSMGNHEKGFLANQDEDLVSELEAAGAHVLDLGYEDIEIRGQRIRIGGMYDYAFALNGKDEVNRDDMEAQVYDFLSEFQETTDFKLMMAHRPDSFVFGDAAEAWDVDMVLSGHDHGGQIVLPVLGGVFGGDQGWFSDYVHGLCDKDGLPMLITSGLGSQDEVLPRFNNPPEVMVLELQ